MKMSKVYELLVNNGYDVELTAVMKNGIEKRGIVIKIEDKACPTIYEDFAEHHESEDEILELIKQMIEEAPTDVNIREIISKEYILKHVVPCVQKASFENITKFRVWSDLEEYFRITVDNISSNYKKATIKIKDDMLEEVGMTASELRKQAHENLKNKASIKSMFAVLSEQFAGITDMDIEQFDNSGMYVGTTDDGMYGASIMILEDMLADFAKKHNAKELIIIPSSIHEIIIIPIKGNEIPNEEELDSMVVEVNETHLDELERLSDHTYKFYI